MFDPMIHRRLRARHERVRQMCRALNIDVPEATDPTRWPAIVTPTAQIIIDAIGAAAEKGEDPAADATVQTLLARREIGRDHHLQHWREYQATQIDEKAIQEADDELKEAVQDAFAAAVDVFEETADDLRGLDQLGGEIDWRDAAKIAEPMAQAIDAERDLKVAVELWWALHTTSKTGTPRDQVLAWMKPTGLQFRSVELMEDLDQWAKTPWRLWRAGVTLELCEDVNDWHDRCRKIHGEADAVPKSIRDQWGRVGALADQLDRELPPPSERRRGVVIV